MRFSLISFVGTAAVTLQAACIAVAKPTLFVFGDSFSDIGALKELTHGAIPSFPYWEGRWSSGPMWNEYLSLLLDYNLDNMAIGAASIDNAVESLLPSGVPIQIPSVQDQINTFKNEHPRYSLSTTRNDDIAALFVSAVDYLANIIRLMHNTTAPIKYATIVSDGILILLDQLKEIGFKNIYVGNMAAFQYTPLVKTLKIQAVTKTSVDLANQMIRDKTAAWAKANSIGLFDIADLGKFVEVTQGSSAIASALGLTNIEDACVGGELRRLFQDGNLVQHLIDLVINLDEVLMCRSPTEYYFFDSVHPSERMHRLFGYFTYEAITAQRSGSTFSLNEANIISVIQKYSLNSAAPKPASL